MWGQAYKWWYSVLVGWFEVQSTLLKSPLRKHAYSNISKISPPQTEKI